MGLEIIKKTPLLTRLMLPLWQWDAHQKFKRLEPFLSNQDSILELGCGLGTVTDYFQKQGLKVQPVDIENFSIFPRIKPIVYDGKNIPFKDKSFDIVLLLTVLHHVSDIISVLTEAKRAGQKIIIIEDIYDNKIQQYFTYAVDSIVNFEFQGHPHNNRTDTEWKTIFQSLKLKLVYQYDYSFVYLFKQVIYILEVR
ncbi:MAG: class I SAM-dependent methyltransferase [Microcystaceae cyanobacterium]